MGSSASGGGDDDLRGGDGAGADTGLPLPRLLGAFDPVLMGWTSREPVLGPHQSAIVAGGLFRPFALIGGRAAATWRLVGNEVTVDPFTPLTAGG